MLQSPNQDLNAAVDTHRQQAAPGTSNSQASQRQNSLHTQRIEQRGLLKKSVTDEIGAFMSLEASALGSRTDARVLDKEMDMGDAWKAGEKIVSRRFNGLMWEHGHGGLWTLWHHMEHAEGLRRPAVDKHTGRKVQGMHRGVHDWDGLGAFAAFTPPKHLHTMQEKCTARNQCWTGRMRERVHASYMGEGACPSELCWLKAFGGEDSSPVCMLWLQAVLHALLAALPGCSLALEFCIRMISDEPLP